MALLFCEGETLPKSESEMAAGATYFPPEEVAGDAAALCKFLQQVEPTQRQDSHLLLGMKRGGRFGWIPLDQSTAIIPRVQDDILIFRRLMPVATSDNESSKLGHVIALLKKLVTGQRRLEKGLHASLWFTFWGDIASTVTSETTVQFRKSLVDYYGDEMDKNNVDDAKLPLRCMVTDLRLPGTWITAAHLLGRKHSTKAHVFGFHDIDDPRNGLLWNRAFEEAYSYYRTVFSWDRDNNSFCIHVLDKDLLGENISGIKMRKPFNRSMDTFMDVQTIKQFNEMTFGDLQGKLVSFNNLNRPFKRVLCLHAKLGIQKAKEEGSLPAGLDLGQYNFDYWTESSDSILLRTFLEDSQPWIKESDLEERHFEQGVGEILFSKCAHTDQLVLYLKVSYIELSYQALKLLTSLVDLLNHMGPCSKQETTAQK